MSNIDRYYAHAFIVSTELADSNEVMESIRGHGIKRLKEQHPELMQVNDDLFRITKHEHDRQNVVYDLVMLRVEIDTKG